MWCRSGAIDSHRRQWRREGLGRGFRTGESRCARMSSELRAQSVRHPSCLRHPFPLSWPGCELLRRMLAQRCCSERMSRHDEMDGGFALRERPISASGTTADPSAPLGGILDGLKQDRWSQIRGGRRSRGLLRRGPGLGPEDQVNGARKGRCWVDALCEGWDP